MITEKYLVCERCGRHVYPNGRKRPVVVCWDCYQTDPDWLRMVSNAR